MASRAPVLAKPKPKAKPTAKSSALKTTKSTSTTKNPVAKVTTKNSVTKDSVSKVTANRSVAKPSPTKASLVKSSTASKTSVSKTLSVSDASSISTLAKSLPAGVKGKLAKPAESKLTLVSKAGKTPMKQAQNASVESALLDSVAKLAGTASFEPAVPKPRRRSKGEIRTRIYWAVFNQSLRRVAVFEFDQRVEAEKRADKLAKASGEHHFIQKIKAIVQ